MTIVSDFRSVHHCLVHVQIGNAVAPPMARKLGLCIIVSLTQPFTGHGTREDEHVTAVRDAEMDEVGGVGEVVP